MITIEKGSTKEAKARRVFYLAIKSGRFALASKVHTMYSDYLTRYTDVVWAFKVAAKARLN